MEVLEIVVYLSVAMIIGASLIFFMNNFSQSNYFDKIKSSLTGEKSSFEKVSLEEFPSLAYGIWRDCGYGVQDMNKTVYLTSESNQELNKTYLFDVYKSINLCDSIQSSSLNCGSREDVSLTTTQLPAIIRVSCTNKKLIIE